jgi:predicted regulator of Ras-like GTPase activity (Roadblock/LC7/MglB family)
MLSGLMAFLFFMVGYRAAQLLSFKEQVQITVMAKEFIENQQEQIRQLQNIIKELQENIIRSANAYEALQKESELLKRENQDLKTRLEPEDFLPPLLQRLGQEQFENVGNSLETVLKKLSQSGRVQSAVWADQEGLVVAGADEQGESLAVVAAMFDELVSKLPDSLPLHQVKQIKLIDENGTVIMLQSVPVTSGRLILVQLRTAFGGGI